MFVGMLRLAGTPILNHTHIYRHTNIIQRYSDPSMFLYSKRGKGEDKIMYIRPGAVAVTYTWWRTTTVRI
jgi:hypothetical protein